LNYYFFPVAGDFVDLQIGVTIGAFFACALLTFLVVWAFSIQRSKMKSRNRLKSSSPSPAADPHPQNDAGN
jgi:hypothetical protein